jgi:hypothetical protein
MPATGRAKGRADATAACPKRVAMAARFRSHRRTEKVPAHIARRAQPSFGRTSQGEPVNRVDYCFAVRRFSMRRPLSPCSLAKEKAFNGSQGNSSHLPQCSRPFSMQHLASVHSPQNTLPPTSRQPGHSVLVRKWQAWHSRPQYASSVMCVSLHESVVRTMLGSCCLLVKLGTTRRATPTGASTRHSGSPSPPPRGVRRPAPAQETGRDLDDPGRFR